MDTQGSTTVTNTNGLILVEDVDGYVKARNTNGDIEIRGTTGVGNLGSTNGRVTAEIWNLNDDVAIASVNGGISLFLHPLLNATLEVSTTNGGLVIDTSFLSVNESSNKYFLGRLGNNGYRIAVETTNGVITISPLEI